MKKRFFALLLAVCIACTMLVMTASAGGSNTAVQAAVMLGGLDSGQDAGAALTRGQLAKLLAAFSSYRESAAAGNTSGALFTDVAGSDPLAAPIRIAVQQGWMSGYSDGSFRPSNTVTLEEACAAVLNLLGYDVTTLNDTFPTAQLNKARELGLRSDLAAGQGDTLTIADGALLLYNALTAQTAEGETYGSTLGLTVTDGQVDVSSVLLEDVEGPFVADDSTQLPFEPEAVYRNDEVTNSASLHTYDVYYYNVNARTLWIYTTKAAGQITAVSPSASAPTSVTVAGTEYTIGSSQAASALSNAGGAAAMRRLRELNPDMTAVFISNYEMTVGAMMEINDLGIRVPDELSVIGFDNVDFAKASVPKLSIVTQPTAQIAREAADTLIEKLEGKSIVSKERQKDAHGEKTTITVTLKTGFVEGRSVKELKR